MGQYMDGFEDQWALFHEKPAVPVSDCLFSDFTILYYKFLHWKLVITFAIIGLLGDLLSIYVLLRPKVFNATNALLISLCLSQLLSMLSYTVHCTLVYKVHVHCQLRLAQLWVTVISLICKHIATLCRSVNAWLMLIICVVRIITLSRHGRVLHRGWLTNRKALIMVVTVCVGVPLLRIPTFMRFRPQTVPNGSLMVQQNTTTNDTTEDYLITSCIIGNQSISDAQAPNLTDYYEIYPSSYTMIDNTDSDPVTIAGTRVSEFMSLILPWMAVVLVSMTLSYQLNKFMSPEQRARRHRRARKVQRQRFHQYRRAAAQGDQSPVVQPPTPVPPDSPATQHQQRGVGTVEHNTSSCLTTQTGIGGQPTPQIADGSVPPDPSRPRRPKRTTNLLIAFMLLYLIFETPWSLCQLYTWVFGSIGHRTLFTCYTHLHDAFDLFIVVQYGLTFWVFFVMSEQFRFELVECTREKGVGFAQTLIKRATTLRRRRGEVIRNNPVIHAELEADDGDLAGDGAAVATDIDPETERNRLRLAARAVSFASETSFWFHRSSTSILDAAYALLLRHGEGHTNSSSASNATVEGHQTHGHAPPLIGNNRSPTQTTMFSMHAHHSSNMALTVPSQVQALVAAQQQRHSHAATPTATTPTTDRDNMLNSSAPAAVLQSAIKAAAPSVISEESRVPTNTSFDTT